VKNQYLIRPAQPSDRENLIDLSVQLQAHLESTTPGIWKKSMTVIEQQIDTLFSDPHAYLLIAETEKGEIVGMAIGQVEERKSCLPERYGMINTVFVTPSYRQQGVGSQLVAALCGYFQDQGIEDLTLRYVIGNTEAEKFWNKLGFQPRIVIATRHCPRSK
jgi:GNAT superfamily N-acetyltransferase